MKQTRVGNARVNFSSLIFEGDAGRYSVEPRVLEVLEVLIEHHGEVVSRDDLIDRVWGIGYGGDERLSRAVSLLRKAFGEKRGEHSYIETISKRGYRLIAPVDGKERKVGIPAPLAHFNMEAQDEDVFFLSNGHISPVWYSVLARSGYFPVEELTTFRQINSRLQGHPATHEGLPGVRVASGSLGQGLSVAMGVALAKKMNNDPHTVYALTGDGELQEGQIWEALMFAPHNKIDNLIVTVDWNGQQIDGSNEKVLSLGDLEGKWRTFGWEVMHAEGNNMENIVQTLERAKTLLGNGKPIVILMKTDMGYGVDFMMGSHKWHGVAPNPEQLLTALGQLEETMGDYPYNPNYQTNTH